MVRDAPDDVSEDHTSCSLSSIGVDDQDDPGCGLAERGPPEDRDREGGAVAGLPEDREHGVPRRELGDPARRDGEPPALPAQSGSWGVPAAPTWTKQQWDDWEAWENQQAEDGDDVNLMQRTGAGGNDDVDETDDPPSEGASGSGQAPGGGPPGGPAARPSLCLTLVEQQGLLDAGWPLHHVEHITMFAEYLEDTANQYGIEAVAWGNDGWGDALVMANATAELAQELLWDRLRDVQVVRPEDQAARGRVAVGWAGFQKQLGALHLEIMTEALRHQWLPNGVDDDGRRLPVPPFVRGDHNAWALARARTIARELVQRSRTLGAERRAAQARGERDPGEREPGHDVPVVGVGEGRDQRGDRDDGDASVEDAMEDLADASDEQALMELTAAEERVLDQLDVTTEARRHLRSLLVSLEQLQGHGEGAEYRWGVAQLVQSWDGALGIVNAMRDILQVRTTPMGCLPHYPAVREPRYGPLRTRVGSYMEEFRYMLLRCLSEEGGLRLRELVAGGPTAGVRAEPGAAVETVQAMRSGRNTRRVRRVSGVVPRGSRSRSRTPASELEMPREDGGDIVTVSSSSSDVGASAAVAGRGRGAGSGVGSAGPPAVQSGAGVGPGALAVLPEPPVLPVLAVLPESTALPERAVLPPRGDSGLSEPPALPVPAVLPESAALQERAVLPPRGDPGLPRPGQPVGSGLVGLPAESGPLPPGVPSGPVEPALSLLGADSGAPVGGDLPVQDCSELPGG